MKRIGYSVSGGLIAFASFFSLFLALDAGKNGAELHSNILCVAAIILAMWFPGLLISSTIERRLDRLEKLLGEKNSTSELE